MRARQRTDPERFFSWVRPQPSADGCWIWTGASAPDGRGRFCLNPTEPRSRGPRVAAPRWSWEYHNGAIPGGMFVCHKCDTPSCVNPGHLFLGSHTDNMADRGAKRRQARGERAGRARLTWDLACSIRAECAAGSSQRAQAAKHGVSRTLVSFIVRRMLWKDDCAEGLNPKISPAVAQ